MKEANRLEKHNICYVYLYQLGIYINTRTGNISFENN